ncbi:MAG: DUF3592 domain-containing protein [Pirellulaceae bacterium]|nr:DUF3592 domain-containing protein [Pirellulaceae bacterium]
METCQATTKKGRQCKNKAIPGSKYCRRHQQKTTGPGPTDPHAVGNRGAIVICAGFGVIGLMLVCIGISLLRGAPDESQAEMHGGLIGFAALFASFVCTVCLRKRKKLRFVAPVLLCVVSIGAAVYSGWLQHQKVATYKPAPATLLSTNIERTETEHTDERGMRSYTTVSYRAVVEYKYEVDGSTFTSGRIYPLWYHFTVVWSESQFDAQRILGTMSKPQIEADHQQRPATITVYHKPNDPTDAFVLRRYSPLPFPLLLAPLLAIFAMRFWHVTASGLKEDARARARKITVILWHCAGATAAAYYLLTDPLLYGADGKMWVIVTISVYVGLGLIPAVMLLPSEGRGGLIKNALGMWGLLTGILSFVAFLIVWLLVGFLNEHFRLKLAFGPIYLYLVLAIGSCVAAFVLYALYRELKGDPATSGKSTKTQTERNRKLATRRSMRETKIKQQIDAIGREAFPDSPNVVWSIREIIHKEEDVAFAEVEPNPSDPIGWTRLKFALHFGRKEKPTLAACYGFSDGLWSAVFHVTGYDSSEFDRLLFQGSGQPMPAPEREAWIREHIVAIGKAAFADDPAVSWTLEGMIHKGWYTFVEAKPSPADPIGWSRFKFVLRCEADTQPKMVGGYGLDESGWGVVFEIPDTPSDWQQLHDEADT